MRVSSRRAHPNLYSLSKSLKDLFVKQIFAAHLTYSRFLPDTMKILFLSSRNSQPKAKLDTEQLRVVVVEEKALGGNKQALEEAATADLDITEINKLTAEAIQTPLKSAKTRKAIQVDEMIAEEEEENKNKNTQTSRVKRCPPSKKRTQSIQGKGKNKRSSRWNTITPAVGRLELSMVKPTPGLTPRFDSRVFKTPGLRTPGARERIYNISMNGSPLADSKEIFLTVPVGGGESVRLLASDLQRIDIAQLDPEALGNIKKLSSRLAQICSSIRTHK
ncbi:borealin isoform X2 [Tamandua tetradactyla]|uniref:borealin isoform X2 n=1 Tax=Tamandua tetradactyla TaxID=48850 RepID=UPI004053C579